MTMREEIIQLRNDVDNRAALELKYLQLIVKLNEEIKELKKQIESRRD